MRKPLLPITWFKNVRFTSALLGLVMLFMLPTGWYYNQTYWSKLKPVTARTTSVTLRWYVTYEYQVNEKMYSGSLTLGRRQRRPNVGDPLACYYLPSAPSCHEFNTWGHSLQTYAIIAILSGIIWLWSNGHYRELYEQEMRWMEEQAKGKV
jgi:hypothetical protein